MPAELRVNVAHVGNDEHQVNCYEMRCRCAARKPKQPHCRASSLAAGSCSREAARPSAHMASMASCSCRAAQKSLTG